ncbi:hypothetical protein B0H21DRAFT_825755 [Amylocystis lapponica]|nr:hypothetical protein B0H21DRAFT_827559 [Amylocystis lapponica]KAH9934118.1 hypothetical protein B0H21DRAFT_825755 [Amylocystis lapponica]
MATRRAPFDVCMATARVVDVANAAAHTVSGGLGGAMGPQDLPVRWPRPVPAYSMRWPMQWCDACVVGAAHVAVVVTPPGQNCCARRESGPVEVEGPSLRAGSYESGVLERASSEDALSTQLLGLQPHRCGAVGGVPGPGLELGRLVRAPNVWLLKPGTSTVTWALNVQLLKPGTRCSTANIGGHQLTSARFTFAPLCLSRLCALLTPAPSHFPTAAPHPGPRTLVSPPWLHLTPVLATVVLRAHTTARVAMCATLSPTPRLRAFALSPWLHLRLVPVVAPPLQPEQLEHGRPIP